MKYFTKEWYKTCQNSGWHLNMSVSKNAEEFNEEYYKDLYTRRRRAFVKEEKEVAEVLGEEFSKAKAEVEFMNRHEDTVKRMEESIPQNILAEVADTRVLALDIATKEVRQKLKAWCEGNMKEMHRVTDLYWKQICPELKDAVGEEIQKNFNFHDAVIKSMEMKTDSLAFRMEHSDVKKVIFKNYKILEQDGYLLGATWLYQEVYAVEGGNEYHGLLWKDGGKLAYLTIQAEDIEFVK
ncbi:MAG: DUF4085 family protein [Anaerotignum sp.]|nr:DUF4085 family protein [Anaerotignum sp.]